jgi:ADP-ribose pyrophosphatase YjhB (NUDIX family)
MQPSWRRVAAYVVCRDATGRILLTRFVREGHPDTGKWTMPGGAMEWGEQPIDTAARELQEETGLRAELGRIAGVYSHWLSPDEAVTGEAGHVVGIVYEATNARGELRTDFPGDADDTTDAAGWFTLEEARVLPHVALVSYCLGLCSED